MDANEKLKLLVDKQVNIGLFINLMRNGDEYTAYDIYNNVVGYWATLSHEEFDRVKEILSEEYF